MSDWNTNVINEFRANKGKVGGPFDGAKMIILTTTGAKSGVEREIPLVYLEDEGRIYVIASKGGAPTNPDWYHNLIANPDVTAEIGEEKFRARAVEITGAKRDELYAKQVAVMPGFGDYEKKTDRVIPVIELVRQ